MFFFVEDLCAFSYKETVYAVVFCLSLAVGMNATARDDHDVGVFSYIKIVVYDVVNSANRNACGNICRLPHRSG